MRLDSLDVRILQLLSDNGRIQYKDMARKLHVSIPTVKARVEKLKQLGVIKKFTIIVDRSKLLDNIQAVLLIKVMPKYLSSVVKQLQKMQEVRELYVLSGRYDLLAKIEANGLKDIGSFVSDRLSSIEGINDLECTIIIEASKEDDTPIINEGTALNVRCDFCKALIVEKPIVEIINGGKYYFSSKECVEAFKQKIKERKHLEFRK